jgi:hypothetical protein
MCKIKDIVAYKAKVCPLYIAKDKIPKNKSCPCMTKEV